MKSAQKTKQNKFFLDRLDKTVDLCLGKMFLQHQPPTGMKHVYPSQRSSYKPKENVGVMNIYQERLFTFRLVQKVGQFAFSSAGKLNRSRFEKPIWSLVSSMKFAFVGWRVSYEMKFHLLF